MTNHPAQNPWTWKLVAETHIYARKEMPQPINHERSEDWLKTKDQPRNNKGQFRSPSKNAEKEGVGLNLSIVSDEEFDCYNKSDGKLIHTNIDDELQLLPKENKLTPDQGIHEGKNQIDYLFTAKQTEKLDRVPYHANNNKKKLTNNGKLLHEETPTTMEESKNENQGTVRQKNKEIRIIRTCGNFHRNFTGQIRRGDVSYIDPTLNRINTDNRQTDIWCY